MFRLIRERCAYPPSLLRQLGVAGVLVGLPLALVPSLAYAGNSAAQGYALQNLGPDLIQQLLQFLTMPMIAALLVAGGFLLLALDLLTSGFGLAGLAGVALFGLFFWAHAQVGMAGWEGIALVLIGLVLLGVEVVLVPGFGAAGVLGIVALLSGVFVSLLGEGVATTNDLRRAAYTVAGALALMVAGVVLLVRSLPRSARLRGLVLQTHVGSLDTVTRSSRHTGSLWRWIDGARLDAETSSGAGGPITDRLSLQGAMGIARSPLRPGGIAEIGGQQVDVVSEGAYIPAGAPIEVIADEGYRRVVRQRTER